MYGGHAGAPGPEYLAHHHHQQPQHHQHQHHHHQQQREDQFAAPAVPPPPPIVTNSNVTALFAAQFQTPPGYPSPLHVAPPRVPPHLRRPECRWSTARYCNPDVPSYVPPELLIVGDGRPLAALLQRARLEDIKNSIEGVYFSGRGGELPRDFRGSAADALWAVREQHQREFSDAARKLQLEQQSRDPAGGRDPANTRIVRKIYFTQAQLDSGVYGALFGSRGATQKQLQTETKCRIVVAGRGITDPLKLHHGMDAETARRLAEEDPHVCITAPNEKALRDAVQRVEFLISDDIDAVRLREENKRRADIDNGLTSRPQQAQQLALTAAAGERGAGGGAAGGGGPVRPPRPAAEDRDVQAFLASL